MTASADDPPGRRDNAAPPTGWRSQVLAQPDLDDDGAPPNERAALAARLLPRGLLSSGASAPRTTYRRSLICAGQRCASPGPAGWPGTAAPTGDARELTRTSFPNSERGPCKLWSRALLSLVTLEEHIGSLELDRISQPGVCAATLKYARAAHFETKIVSPERSFVVLRGQ